MELQSVVGPPGRPRGENELQEKLTCCAGLEYCALGGDLVVEDDGDESMVDLQNF